MSMNLKDYGAAEISRETYKRNEQDITISTNHEVITYKVIEPIEDPETGLHGYVLQNEKNDDDIVISFEGTQKDEGATQLIRDGKEDINSIIFGDSDYIKAESKPQKYRGSPTQDALLTSGQAKIEDGKFIKINKNQFTVADPIVTKQVQKYGAENITFIGHSLGGALSEYFAVKHDSHAITFAAPDIYNILTDKQKQKVNNGDFQDNIISYAYPDDLVSSYNHRVIGSTYYLSDPNEDELKQSLKNHSLKNYTKKSLFDKDGYFIPKLLYTHGLVGHPETSPLQLKNNGVGNFNILIQASIMRRYSQQVEEKADLIERTEKALKGFLDYYEDSMKEMKNKYINQAGSGEYNLLNSSDVNDLFSNLGKMEKGIPFIFDVEHYEEILHNISKLRKDTEEISFHMDKMGNDFEKTDNLLAEWLKF